MLPVLLKSVAVMLPPTSGYPFSLCLASLSQKWNVPSAPAVEKVPWTGWNEMALTEKTFEVLRSDGEVTRWHLKLKLLVCFSSGMYWIAQRPSILPIAYPEASLNVRTVRVCHFRGDWMDLKKVPGVPSFPAIALRADPGRSTLQLETSSDALPRP